MSSLAEGDTLTAPLETEITLTVNEHAERLTVDNRSTLLDVLRERLGWTGTKKDAIRASAAPARSCWTAAG